MAAGYIYVLVNSSMPGLLKVGKTSRLPSERESELSGVTGVPTPFVVAFEQFFTNCDLAEDFVHAALEQRGLRQATNREFFRAAPNDVVRIILQAPGLADGPCEVTDIDDADADLLSPDAPDDELQLEQPRPRKPWDDILEEADAYYYGEEDSIQDYEEALELYKQAARLGSLVAYENIGFMYYMGEGVKEDENMAFKFYKEGAKRGNYYCYTKMAGIFSLNQAENARKSWSLFFKGRREGIRYEVETSSNKFWLACSTYIEWCIQWHPLPDVKIDFQEDMRAIGQELYDYFYQKIDPELSESRQPRPVWAKEWVSNNLLETPKPAKHETADQSKDLLSEITYPHWKPNEQPTAPSTAPKPQRRWWQAKG